MTNRKTNYCKTVRTCREFEEELTYPLKVTLANQPKQHLGYFMINKTDNISHGLVWNN